MRPLPIPFISCEGTCDGEAPRRARQVAALAALALIAACGPSAQPVPAPSAEKYPEYTPEQASLFDDTFSPAVFGAPVDKPPGEDPKLRERTRLADSVVRAKVATLTRDRGPEGSPSYQLGLRPLEPAWRGETPDQAVFAPVNGGSPAYPFVASADAVLVGRVVVLFVRRYNEGGSATLHWHGEPDTQEVRAAIEKTPRQ